MDLSFVYFYFSGERPDRVTRVASKRTKSVRNKWQKNRVAVVTSRPLLAPFGETPRAILPGPQFMCDIPLCFLTYIAHFFEMRSDRGEL